MVCAADQERTFLLRLHPDAVENVGIYLLTAIEIWQGLTSDFDPAQLLKFAGFLRKGMDFALVFAPNNFHLSHHHLFINKSRQQVPSSS